MRSDFQSQSMRRAANTAANAAERIYGEARFKHLGSGGKQIE